MKRILLAISFLITCFFLNAQIVITEINYNTPGAVDSLDFIEIYNNSGSPINISGWKFKKAITHTIGTATINANQYQVFCYDSLAFLRNFGFSANQWRSNALSNSADSLVLENSTGTVIDFVYYTDASPWPTLADGEGPSMVLCNPSSDNNVASNWTYGGTPTGIIVAGKEIYAHPNAGCSLTDIAPPIPFSAFETSATTVEVYFNEAVNTTATNVSNYTGLGTVTSAVRNGSNDIVTLTLATPLVIGKYYVLTVNNVQDLTSNAMSVPRTFNIVFNNVIASVAMEEIYYNDPFLNDTLEFVEIVNYGTSNVELGGYWFDKGIKLRLPEKTLAPNEYYVVAKDSLLIYLSYGVQAKQWSSGGLGNTSESITLTNSLFQVIDSFYYSTAALTSTNGTGASLVVCPPYTNLRSYNDNIVNWTAEIARSDNANLRVVGGRNTIVSPGRYNCQTNGIESNELDFFQITPNATSTSIELVSTFEGMLNATLYNAIGGIESTFVVQHATNIYDLSSIAKGMHLLQIEIPNLGSKTFKIFKY